MTPTLWTTALSDLLINLSAGWIGAAIITPTFLEKPRQLRVVLLIYNILAGIVCLALGVEIKTHL